MMTTTFDFFAGGLTDFVMPPCPKLGDAEPVGEDLYPLVEQVVLDGVANLSHQLLNALFRFSYISLHE
jgi:hypothetical protein